MVTLSGGLQCLGAFYSSVVSVDLLYSDADNVDDGCQPVSKKPSATAIGFSESISS